MQSFQFNIQGNLLSFDKPSIMAILNLTPDSFYDGAKLKTDKDLLNRVEIHLNNGATFLDIGGYSTRPKADYVGIDEELKRVIPAIELIKKNFNDAIISIDTFRAQVANEAIQAGAHIINDISAGDDDPLMFATVAKLQVPYIIMHKQGTPSTMQNKPQYNNVVVDVCKYLADKVYTLNGLGVNDIIVDPGFGFGKTVEHNYQLLAHLDHFKELDCPLLIGVSRKSMIHKLLKTSPMDALNGTTALHTLALLKGAQILRVHDVKEANECITIYEAYQNGNETAL